jgi:anthranilate synthase/aminodeoxychorismate synthase-like glutamine amidotransferase
MILLIDNYDSFTYNLFQELSALGADVSVRRNDAVTVDEVRDAAPAGVVVSPGPGDPSEAGVSTTLLASLDHTPVLGVCLGHQCIGAAFGGKVVHAAELMHGKTSLVYHSGVGVFAGLPSPFEAVRYHSLTVDRTSLPQCLEVTAETIDGTIMGLRHRSLPVEGVQFHPESILTREGSCLLRNFLIACGEVDAYPQAVVSTTREV